MNPLEILAFSAGTVALAAVMGGIFFASILVVCRVMDIAAPVVEELISDLMCWARRTKP